MKNIFILSVTTAALLTSASAIEITDYQVIDNYYENAYLNGRLNVDSGNQDQTSYDLHINANAEVVKSTLPYSWDLRFDGNSDFSRDKNSSAKALDSYDSTLIGHVDKYLHSDDNLFIYGAGTLGYQKGILADKADDPFVKVSAGSGYGRVYNATPLAKALRIVEDLLTYKIIKSDISDKAYIALATIISKENDYISKYSLDEYKKYWYEAMEKVFKDNGALDKESLGAFGIVRINEILDIERVSPRLHGWKVRGGLGKILSNYDGKSTDATVDAEFEYGLPIGHEVQFTELLTMSKLLDSSTDTTFSLQNNMGYTYELSNRIDWENNWLLGYQQHDVADDLVKNTFATGFRYYLANRLSFDTTFSLSKISSGRGKELDWNKNFFAGINYRLK